MILSDKTILNEIKEGNIIIEPFDQELLNPGSLDIKLGSTVKTYIRETLYWKNRDEIPEVYKNGKIVQTSIGKEWFYRAEKALDPKEKLETEELTLPEEGMILHPNEIYLYAAHERIGVKGNICSTVKAKSSLGRLGLDIVIGPAGFIDSGFEGSLVLELRATRPIIVYPNMKIAQLLFHRVEGEVLESYDQKKGSKYHNQKGVQESLYYENFSL